MKRERERERVGSRFKGLLLLLLLTALTMAGCGGGGDSSAPPNAPQAATTVSGTALGGAPIVGTAYLKDSSAGGGTTISTPISPDGSFSFDTKGLTPPFFLRAEGLVGGSYVSLYSIAADKGIANINPLTNIIAARTLGETDPATAYNNPTSGHRNKVTSTNLATVINEIKDMLKNLLTAYDAQNINPLTDQVAANHKGLDAVLDVTKIELTGGNFTVKNAIDDTPIIPATNPTVGALPQDKPADVPPPAIMSDIEAIELMLGNFATMLNSKMDKLTIADLQPYYASGENGAAPFTWKDGRNRAQIIAKDSVDIPTVQSLTITKLGNVRIEEKLADNRYRISVSYSLSDGSNGSNAEIVFKEGANWKYAGNGYRSRADIQATTHVFYKTDGSTLIKSGLQFGINDFGASNLVKSAKILFNSPNQFIIMNMTNWGWMDIIPAMQDPTITFNSGQFLPVSDAAIDAWPDNMVLTVEIYDALNCAGNLVETRKIHIVKGPVKPADFNTATMLPTIGGDWDFPSQAAPYAIANILPLGKTFNITYQKPSNAAFAANLHEMNVSMNYSDNLGHQANYWQMVPLTGNQVSIITAQAGWVPTWGNVSFSMEDRFNRRYHADWQFQ